MKRCVILGAGLIGQQFVRLLDAHPYFELTEVVASEKSEGQSLKSKWNLPSFEIPDMFSNLKLSSTPNLTPDSYDIVFSALPASMAKDIELEMAQNGKQVFSNASAHR
ncbi:MAG: Gfo/Idh/MocA family oxidoreductase, partial [Candidatus Hodarchaeales archaeon]